MVEELEAVVRARENQRLHQRLYHQMRVSIVMEVPPSSLDEYGGFHKYMVNDGYNEGYNAGYNDGLYMANDGGTPNSWMNMGVSINIYG